MNTYSRDFFIGIWAELDALYVDLGAAFDDGNDDQDGQRAEFGDYEDATLFTTGLTFSDTLLEFDEYTNIVADMQDTGAEIGRVALFANSAFVKLGNLYVDWLLSGNAAIEDIAKPRGATDPGQSYHDNILANLGDGAIFARFGQYESLTVSARNDGLDEVVADPRSPEAVLFGERPAYSGFAAEDGTDLPASIAWDVANLVTRADRSPLDGTVHVVSANRDDGVADVTFYADADAAAAAAQPGDQIIVGAGTVGGSGNDILLGSDADDSFVGGAGTDTAVVADNIDATGASQPYVAGDFDYSGLTVTGGSVSGTMTGPDGAETLDSIEVIAVANTGSSTYVVLAGMSIQAAIDAAAEGDTIVAAAGTFTENLVIDKGLTLLGAQAGTVAQGSARAGGESVLNGPGTFGITILADNVTIDGFEITDFGRDAINIRTLEDANPSDASVGAYRANVTIANTRIHDDAATGQRNGILVGEFSGDPARSVETAEVEGLEITGNVINLASDAGRALSFTNHFDFMTFTGVEISGNRISSGSQAFFNGAETDSFRFEGMQLTGNTFVSGSFNTYNLFSSTIDGNTFNDIVVVGIDGSTVSNNVFNVGDFYGLGLFGDEFGTNVSQNSTIATNTFNFNIGGTTSPYIAGLALRSGVDVASIDVEADNIFNDGESNGAIPVADIILRGTPGDDTLSASSITDSSGTPYPGSVQLVGYDGNDTLTGGAGDDDLLGGAGVDVAAFSGDRADYTVSINASGDVSVTGPDGSDSGVGVERLTFDTGPDILIVAPGTFTTIQAAIDAADPGDTIYIAAGNYAENLSITKAVSLVGVNGQVVVDSASGTGVTIDGSFSGAVSFDNVSLDGAGGATIGLTVIPGAGAIDLSITNGSIANFSNRGIYVSDDADPANLGALDSLTLSDVDFSGNGTGNFSNTAHIKLFGYDGDVTLTNVDFAGTTGVVGSAGRPDNAIEIVVALFEAGNANPTALVPTLPTPVTDLGTVTFDNVSVTGQYHKNPVALFNAGSVDGLTINSLDVSGAESGWALFNIDGVTGDIDASGYGITFPAPAGAGIVTELQGEKAGQPVTGNVISGTDANDGIYGKLGDDSLSGGDGDDVLLGGNKGGYAVNGEGNDTLNGDAGDDTLNGGLGDDSLDGGADTDTAVYSGAASGYSVTTIKNASGLVTGFTVTDNDTVNGDEGSDSLTSIELLSFDNGATVLDLTKAVQLFDSSDALIGTFDTISDAVTAAGTDNTIIVGAGTYTENVVIPNGLTGLTLVGANAGISAGLVAGTRGAESVLNGTLQIGTGGSGVSGFTLDGFTVNTPAGGNTARSFVTDDFTVQNSIFNGDLGDPGKAFDVDIASVLIDISDNDFNGYTRALEFDGNNLDPASTITGNTFDAVGAASSGILLQGSIGPGMTISANGFDDSFIALGPDGITVANNVFENGARVLNFANDSVSVIENNSFTGGSFVSNDFGATGTLDAAANWWGTTDQAAIDALNVGDVATFPPLQTGTDLEPGTPGFQGALFDGDGNDNTLSGTVEGDVLRGFGGDDTMTGGAGDDIMLGGDDADVGTFSGNVADYTISVALDGTITVTDTRPGSPDGTDTLVAVEALKFADGFGVANGMSIQAAIDAAAAGDTIFVAAGNYAENLSIDQAVSLVGVGGQVIVESATGTGVTVGGTTTGAVSFENISLDGSGGASTGLIVTAGTGAIDLTMTNGAIENFATRGIYASDEADPANLGALDSLTLSDMGFSGNGTGSGNTADIKLFGYDGDVTLTNVDFAGTTGVVGSAGKPDNAIEIVVALFEAGNANPTALVPTLPTPVTDLGNVTLTNVSITGQYAKNPVALFNFGEIDGLTINSLDLSNADSGWALFNIDGTTETDIDASGFGITFPSPAGAGVVTELQGEKAGQPVTGNVITGTDANDGIYGKLGDDSLSGGDGDDVLLGGNKGGYGVNGEGNDTLNGDAGDDTLNGGLGDDSLDGGADTDTAVYGGPASGYTVGTTTDALGRATGFTSVTDNDTVNGDEGTDSLTSVELLSFDNGATVLDLAKAVQLFDSSDALIGTFDTISEAVTAAGSDNTIIVGAGTYTEDLTISKQITILGENAGTAGSDAGRVAESVIDGTITISATGPVVIDGMKMLNNAPVSARGGIDTVILTTGAGHIIRNSVFESTVAGGAIDDRAIFSNALGSGSSFSIIDNVFTGDSSFDDGDKYSTAAWGRGIWSNGGDGVAVTITGNDFSNTRTGLNLENYDNAASAVSGNSFVDAGTGISIGQPTAGPLTSIATNTFTDVDFDFNARGLSGDIAIDLGATGNAALVGDRIIGTEVDDPDGTLVFISGDGADAVTGTSANDVLVGDDPFDAATDGSGDSLYGGAGNDTLVGLEGDDLLDGGLGNDSFEGGAGIDTAVLADGGGSPVTLADFTLTGATITGGSLSGTFDGPDGTETLTDIEVLKVANTGSDTFIVYEGMSIQAAIDAAAAGDTILVAAGTYVENLSITKALTITGDGATIQPASGTAFAISGDINAGATLAGVSSDVTISGFDIVGAGNGTGVRVASTTVLDSLTVSDGTISGFGTHGVGSLSTSLGAVTVRDMVLTDNGQGGGNGSGDIILFEFLGDATIENVNIVSNRVESDATATKGDNAIQIAGFDASTYDVDQPIGTVTLTNVTTSGAYHKPHLAVQGYTDLAGLSFSNVSLDGAAEWGFLVFIDPVGSPGTAAAGTGGYPGNFDGSATGVDSTDLTGLSANLSSGFSRGYDVFVRGTDADATITGTETSDFLNAPAEGLTDFGGDDTVLGQGGDDTLVGGLGNDSLDGGADTDTALYSGPASDYTVTTATDINGVVTITGVTDNDTTNGNEGTDTLTNIEVLAFDGGETFDLSQSVLLFDGTTLLGTFDTILDAVDAAKGGETIRVASGNVNLGGSQIVVDVDLTIEGAGIDDTTLVADFSTGTGGDSRGLFLVEDGISLDVSDLTLDGDGNDVWQGFRHKGTGSFENVGFTDLKFFNNGTDGQPYAGTAIAAFGGVGPVDVINSTFDDIGRIGVLYFGAGTTGIFSGNTYTGKGAGDFLDYALDISAGAVVDVTNNTVTNNLGQALSDSSVSAAFLVSTFFAPGTDATFAGNTVSNSTNGIFVGFDDTDTSAVTIAAGNTFESITSDGLRVLGDAVVTGAPLIGGASGTVDHDGGTGDNTIEGAALGDDLSGGAGSDTVNGNGGDDTIDGGADVDSMTGGTGDDLYFVDNAADVIVEAAGEGTDTVEASVSYTLAAGVEVEELTSTGSGLNLTGNEFSQTIIGDSGVNTLSGGDGDDILEGEGGDDLLLGGEGEDSVYGGEGSDRLDGGGSADLIDGGEDAGTVDAAVQYTSTNEIAWNQTLDIWQVGDVGTPGGILDNLTGIEIVEIDKAGGGIQRYLLVDNSGTGGFDSIADALLEAQAGDIILLGEGSFAGATINIPVSIIGLSEGTPGTGQSTGTGSTITSTLRYTAATGDVLIDGVEFLNDSDNAIAYDTLQLAGGANFTIQNNLFWSTGPNGSADDKAIHIQSGATGNVTIQNNAIDGASENLYSTASWSRGIYSDGNAATLEILDNSFQYTRTAINLDGLDDAVTTVTGNAISLAGTGISVGGNGDATITGIDLNTFDDVVADFNLQNFTAPIVFDAAGNTATGSAPTLSELRILGGTSRDKLTGSEGSDDIRGRNGNDSLYGAAGDDIISGDGGNDLIDGGTGGDYIDAGTGKDVIVLEGNDTILGGAGDDILILKDLAGLSDAELYQLMAGQIVALPGGAPGETLGISFDGNPTGATFDITPTITAGVIDYIGSVSGVVQQDASGVEALALDNGGSRTFLVFEGMSLQKIIDFSSDGDTILVAPGNYTGTTPFNGNSIGLNVDKSVTIKGIGEDGALVTDVANIGATFTSGAQSALEGTNILISADNVSIEGLELLGTNSISLPFSPPVANIVTVTGDNFDLDNSVLDARPGANVSSSGFNAVLFDGNDGTSGIDSYSISGNTFHGTVQVAFGVGNQSPGPFSYEITDNIFLDGEGIVVSGRINEIDVLNTPSQAPTIVTGNDFTALSGKVLDEREEVDSEIQLDADFMADFTSSNIFTDFAYVLDSNGDLLIEDVDIGDVNGDSVSDPYRSPVFTEHAIDLGGLAPGLTVVTPGGEFQTAATGQTYVLTEGTETLQSVIDAASPGDTILVGPGTYDEAVTIDKALTIGTLNTGVTPVDGGRATAEVKIGAITITADDVTVDGVEIDGSLSAATGTGITLNGVDTATISHVFLTDLANIGVDVNGVGTAGTIALTDNLLTDVGSTSTSENAGVSIDNVDGLTVSGTTVLGGMGVGIEGASSNDVTISGNTVTGTTSAAITLDNTTGSSVTGNSFSDAGQGTTTTVPGMLVTGDLTGTTISGNAFVLTRDANNGEAAILMGAVAGGATDIVSGALISGNTFDGFSLGIVSLNVDGTVVIAESMADFSNISQDIGGTLPGPALLLTPAAEALGIVDEDALAADTFFARTDDLDVSGTPNDGGMAYFSTVADAASFSKAAANIFVKGSGFADIITGTAFGETYELNDGDDVLNAGEGNNTIDGGDGADSITAGSGDDSIDGGIGGDTIDAGNGTNTVSGGDGDDDITAGTGADDTDGGIGNDTVNAGDGNDTMTGGEGDDSLVGGEGIDTAVFSGNLADYSLTVVVDSGPIPAPAPFVDRITAVLDTVGTDGSDTLDSVEVLQFADVELDLNDPVRLFNDLGNLVGTFGTLQDAVDAAATDYTIVTTGGTFTESVVVDKAVSFYATPGTTNIIDPGGSGSGLRFVGDLGSTNSVTISGFTFQNAGAAGVDFATTAILGTLIVEDSTFDANARNGIRVGGGSTEVELGEVVITDSTFTGNGQPGSSSGDGDILLYQFHGDATLEGLSVTGQDRGTGPAETGIQLLGNFGAMGTVLLKDITVDGIYEKQPIAIFNYDDITGLTSDNVDVTADSTGFNLSLNIDGVGGDFSKGDIDTTGAPDIAALQGNGDDQTITGGVGADFVNGDGGSDSLLGGAGDDSLLGGIGNDTLDGGADSDTAIYGQTKADYDIGYIVDGNGNVTGFSSVEGTGPISSFEGSDTLSSIEALYFDAEGLTLVAADLPTFAIAADAAVDDEGDSGTTALTFTVTRSGNTAIATSVAFAVSSTQADGADFDGGSFPSGTVSFLAGETTKTLTIDVAGDLLVEADEAFTVTLSDPGENGIVLDGQGTANGTIVNDDNTAPAARDDDLTSGEDVGFSGANLFADNGNGADSDADGDGFTIIEVNGSAANVGSQITLASGALLTVLADGTVDFDPNDQFESLAQGEDTIESFTYTIRDDRVPTATDQAQVTITINGDNDDPVADGDTGAVLEEGILAVTDEALGVLANDTDDDTTDDLMVSAVAGGGVGVEVTLASGALITMNADGTYEYDPNGAFDSLLEGVTDTDTIQYTVSDGKGGFDTADLVITITGENEVVQANDDSVSTGEDTPLSGNVFADNGNGVDVDTDGTFTLIEVNGSDTDVNNQITLTSGALLTLNDDGTFDYDPNGQFGGLDDGETGSDSFSYTIRDNDGAESTATVSVTIDGDNDGPSAENDSFVFSEASDLSFGNVLAANGGAADSDPDGDTLTVSAVNGQQTDVGATITLSSGALLKLRADGTFDYDNNGVFDSLGDFQFGTDSFTYTVTDGDITSTASVSMTIVGTDAGPTELDDELFGTGAGERINLLGGDDVYLANGGDDWIDGEDGNDFIVAGAGNDTIEMGLGTDLGRGDAGDDTFLLGAGGDGIWDANRFSNAETLISTAGGADGAVLSGKNLYEDIYDGGIGIDTIVGTDGSDVLVIYEERFTPIFRGQDAADPRIVDIEVFDMGDGDDVVNLSSQVDRSGQSYEIDVTIYGGEGNDRLFSGNGNDAIYAGDSSNAGLAGGFDFVSGGAGNDTLIGGFGVDVFGFGDVENAGTDIVSDFTDGEDFLRVVGFQVTDITDAGISITDDGQDTTITLVDDYTATIVLENILAASITVDDFIFTA